jgi:predicted ABC-type ATPase
VKAVSTLDRRPIIVAVAGSNGAGKTTFYHSHLASSGLRFINADVLAADLGLEPYAAAKVAEALRMALVKRRESFIFETVFSDPAGEKLAFLKDATRRGYTVVLCFIGLENAELSEERVAMRVSQGGHDVPPEKLRSRYTRTLANLRGALQTLPHVIIYDNSELRSPFRKLAEFDHGRRTYQSKAIPQWLKSLGPVK